MSNNSQGIVIRTFPIMRGVVNTVQKRFIGLHEFNDSDDILVEYDIEKGEVGKSVRAIRRQRPILYSDNRNYPRVVSDKGAIFLSIDVAGRNRNKQCALEVYDTHKHSKLFTVILSSVISWGNGMRIADAIRLDNNTDIIICIQEDVGVEDRAIVVEYNEEEKSLRMVDVLEAEEVTFDNVRLTGNGDFRIDLLQKQRYDEPFYYEVQPMICSLKLDESRIEYHLQRPSYNNNKLIEDYGISISQKNYFFGIPGELSIIRRRDNETVLSYELRRLDRVRIQYIRELQIMLICICGIYSKTIVTKCGIDELSYISSIEGNPLSINLDRENMIAILEYSDCTVTIERDCSNKGEKEPNLAMI